MPKKKNRSPSEEYSESPSKRGELEVTGVSRSGRVRKRSSKLLDYESGGEEIDKPKKKHEPSTDYTPTPSTSSMDVSMGYFPIEEPANEVEIGSEGNFFEQGTELALFQPTADDDMFVDTSGSELEENFDNSLPGTSQGSDTPSTSGTTGSHLSLYMSENAKNVRKPKGGRKDKGKARFSAYMLWAKEIRPHIMKATPNIDFSQLSSRLSELWATVPYNEKYNWKRKAQRLAMTAKSLEEQEERASAKPQFRLNPSTSKYINKKAAQVSETKSAANQQQVQPYMKQTDRELALLRASLDSREKMLREAGTSVLDIASCLKLLGEALLVVGKRLKEHEGPISVEQTMTVLLDTLLCGLNVLMALTQQVPELNCIPPDTLKTLLRTVSVTLPGLVNQISLQQ